MFKKITAAVLLAFLLTGASCQTKKTPDPPVVEIDPSLKVACPELPTLDMEQIVSMGTLYLEYSKLQGQYIECAIRMDCLIEATSSGKTKVTCPKLEQLKDGQE